MANVNDDATTPAATAASREACLDYMKQQSSCRRSLEDDYTTINSNSTRSLTVSGSNSSSSFDESHDDNCTIDDDDDDDDDEAPQSKVATATSVNPTKETSIDDEKIEEFSERNQTSNHERYEEEIQRLMYDRDVALSEAETSKEILSCVMEAVQILTKQMKQSHSQMLLDSNQTTDTATATEASSLTQCISLDIPDESTDSSVELLPKSLSTSRDEEEEEEDKRRFESADNEMMNRKRFDFSEVSATTEAANIVTSTDDETGGGGDGEERVRTPRRGNNSNNFKVRDQIILKKGIDSSTSITPSSIANYTSDDNKRFSELLEIASTSNHLETVGADLMALGHSCRMVGENAHLLHNEASTFLVDLQEVNSKLVETQIKRRKAEHLAQKLWKENKKLKTKLQKSKVKEDILVRILRGLTDEKEMRKDFEEHILKAWDVHERMINQSIRKTALGTLESLECHTKNNGQNITNAPGTPSFHISTPPPTSSGSSSIFKQVLKEECSTLESTDNDQAPSKATSSKPYLSFPPVLQLTPTPSMTDGDNAKATLDLDDDSDGGDQSCIETKDSNSKMLSKSKNSISSTPPKPEQSLKNLFSVVSPRQKNLVNKHRQPTSISSPNQTPESKNSKPVPKLFSSIGLLASSTAETKLPPPVKVVKKKKKLYRQYKLGQNP